MRLEGQVDSGTVPEGDSEDSEAVVARSAVAHSAEAEMEAEMAAVMAEVLVAVTAAAALAVALAVIWAAVVAEDWLAAMGK